MHLGAASVDCVAGVELPDACGPLLGTNSSRTPNTVDVYSGSESAGDKLRRREGDSPDLQLRSQIVSKWKTMWKYADNQDVGSEAATHLKSA